MSSISFDNPYLLFIAIPLVVLLCVPFVIAVRKDNVNVHNVSSAVIHTVMALLIAFTAASTKIVTVVTQTDVYVLADVSYSTNKNLDKIDDCIESLSKNLPQNSRMGVICFGKNYKLLTRLGENLKSVREAKIDDSATDIASALSYAGSIFKDGVIKRIVLITDGKESDESDPNALKRAVDALNADHVYVDAIYIDDNLTESSREVQISDAEFSQSVYLNHDEKVTATIRSSYQTQALVSLYKQSEKISERAVTLVNGTNYVSFSLDTTVQTENEYEIRVQAEGDGNAYDNSFKFCQTVSGAVNVLLVSENFDDYVTLMNTYGGKAYVDWVSGDTVPCSIEALCEYDEIVISDSNVGSFKNYELFLESVEKVVSLFGKSLITMGDVGLLNNTDEGIKPLRNMVPVKFGNSELEPKLYTFVIDCSRSMQESGYFEIAKRVACKLVDMLNDDDEVCIIKFDGQAEKVDLTSSSASARESIKEAINQLEVRQSTLIGNGLNEAYNHIKNLEYSNKQVLLISDGVNYGNETYNPITVASEMYLNGIFTSTLYVGKEDPSEVITQVQQAKALLRNIAEASGGNNNYYEIYTLDAVDNVVLDKIAPDNNDDKPEGLFDVKISKRFEAVVDGITDAKYIKGYVNTKSKVSATTVLSVLYRKPDGNNTYVPLYSYWKYGNGKVSSFTSRLAGDWISTWTDAGLDRQFFANMLDDNTPSVKRDYPFLATTNEEGGYCSVEVTPAAIRPDAVAEIKITQPDGQIQSGNLAFGSANYTYAFSTPDVGKYVVEINYSYGGYEYTAQSSFYVSYLNEYDSFATYDASVLHKMVGGNGKVSEDGKLVVENDENEMGVRIVSLTVPMMIACVALFAVDVIVRKLKWNDIKSLFGKVNK